MSDSAERGSARLADAVASQVKQSFPAVSVELTPEREGQYCTLVDFVPPNPDGAIITLYANFDWSFTLECGRFIFFEDEPMLDDDEVAHVRLIVGQIESLARGGFRRSRFDRLIDFGRDRVAPWDA
ncbi:hypothetical protein ACFQRL_00065 [Microbacterium fluvii]|uniref:Uncharacterized protein n=1 Tax=Microbacterium fluvii TaxID=415215 RepID=A0ABW2H7J1_9MICO|nr:hypothetical protein [Microbacterium fluvii]MCU4670979.1 hypothetical protein [Microbacterium fluvii]